MIVNTTLVLPTPVLFVLTVGSGGAGGTPLPGNQVGMTGGITNIISTINPSIIYAQAYPGTGGNFTATQVQGGSGWFGGGGSLPGTGLIPIQNGTTTNGGGYSPGKGGVPATAGFGGASSPYIGAGGNGSNLNGNGLPATSGTYGGGGGGGSLIGDINANGPGSSGGPGAIAYSYYTY
jgi:hypothetical protein